MMQKVINFFAGPGAGKSTADESKELDTRIHELIDRETIIDDYIPGNYHGINRVVYHALSYINKPILINIEGHDN